MGKSSFSNGCQGTIDDNRSGRHCCNYKTLVTLLARRIRDTYGAVAAMRFMRLRGRVARVLLELAQVYGQDVGTGRIVIRQKIGQSEIAAMAGSARENVTRILNEWRRNKLVTRLSGYYCIENKEKLEQLGEFYLSRPRKRDIRFSSRSVSYPYRTSTNVASQRISSRNGTLGQFPPRQPATGAAAKPPITDTKADDWSG